MKILFILPAIGLALTGALRISDSRQAASSPASVIAAVNTSGAAQPPPVMWTSGQTIFKDETLELRFSKKHPVYLGVVDPKGKFFYVVFPKSSAVGDLKPLVDSEQFASMTLLRIKTDTFKADPYTHGIYQNQPVFTQSGTYKFILGDNLHVDDPDLVETVAVKYVHRQRPPVAL